MVDFSKFKNVFCDSLQALDWAYKNGLPKSAIIKTSAPAILWDRRINAYNIEEHWTTEKLSRFQSTIKKLTEEVFDKALSISGIERELALVISQSSYRFQKTIYKAACLEEDDFNDDRLFIHVDGKNGPAGNIMNSPWDYLLTSNPLFSVVDYTLKNDEWTVLNTQGVSYWQRFRIAGYETIVYRLAIKFMKKLPDWMFTKELFVPNENELNIEIGSSLALHGVKISEIKLEPLSNVENIILDVNIELLYETILPIMRKRIEQWVTPSSIEATMMLFKSYLESQLKQFKRLAAGWEKVVINNVGMKKAVLINAPGNIKGQALAYVCKNNGIPLISSQHGVTVEISKAHSMLQIVFENSVADIMFYYNSKIIEIEKRTHFDKSRHYSVGMPLRLLRMKHIQNTGNKAPPIVYISTNLYHMGLSISQKTDYGRARDEEKIVSEVLGILPHKVRYKTYPEDNRRYADTDPVLNNVKTCKNIEIFSKKIDMRYLISEHKVLVTTCATSTLGWPVMSGKPVVFIDQKKNSPLTDDAHASISKGIFVFNDDEHDFHENLREFLSQPIEEIERLWEEKKDARKEMIREYFSAYKNGGSGKRASQIILKECFS